VLAQRTSDGLHLGVDDIHRLASLALFELLTHTRHHVEPVGQAKRRLGSDNLARVTNAQRRMVNVGQQQDAHLT
jgi:hypothetical protein